VNVWALAAAAAALLVYAGVSRRLEGTVVTAAIVFTASGVVLGSKALGLIDPLGNGHTVKRLAEATLAFVLFADASRIDIRALRREATVPARLLGIGLPLTIVAGALVALPLFRSLPFVEALVLAVVLAPTDAALGQAVVTEERLPSRIRQGLNVESGLNDGICVPLLLIALAAAEVDASEESMTGAIRLVGEQIGYGLLGGILGGVAAAAVSIAARRRGWISGPWLQVVPVAGALLSYGIALGLGGSGFIAAFVGGAVYGVLRRRLAEETEHLLEELGGVLDALTFLVFGAVFVVAAFQHVTAAGVVYAVLSLTVIRMLPVAVALLGTGARRPTVAFLGWFGPRGLASIVFAAIVVEEAHLPHAEAIVSTAFVTVTLSVLAHGVTAAPLVRRYVTWFEGHPLDAAPAMESTPAPAQRWRHAASRGDTGPPRPVDVLTR
jgi:NhaP-type Na+/H+ or K+/H+ antiporter